MASMMRGCLLLLAVGVACVVGDIYMHNMRGSNNRLFEGINPNRLFDSQNNDNGGYNQGFMYFLEGSKLTLEWTNQHGAGANPHVHSEVIVQYMCDDASPGVRDGSTNTRIDPNDPDDITRGLHEPASFYRRCAARERNRGIFTADQNVGNRAVNTRQNPGATRYGLECTEERDYYPYWHPTPWKDLAVLTSNVSRCAYYERESQNVQAKGHCELTAEQQTAYDRNGTVSPKPADAWFFNQAGNCTAAGFQWLVDGRWGLKAPVCAGVPTSRDNHLGNAINADPNGQPFAGFASLFNITMPAPWNSQGARCVLRMRYNISTGDFDGWTIDSRSNGANSPVRDNPTVTVYNATTPPIRLRLQLNTDQYFRTFEDRSHVFELHETPNAPCDTIYNLNVRGRRGNIVQNYPAVEYDFVPERLHITGADCVHLQWTGSNSNNNNAAGEGAAGTDRSNVVQLINQLHNLPLEALNWTLVHQGGAFGLNFLNAVRRLALLRRDYENGQPQLNDAAPYFDAGLFQLARGTHEYMSTRNNNFSNRSQKGAIMVNNKNEDLSWKIILAISLFCAICVVGAVVAWGVYGSRHPDTKLGYTWLETKEFFASFGNH